MVLLPGCVCCNSNETCQTFNNCLYWADISGWQGLPSESGACSGCSGSYSATATAAAGCSGTGAAQITYSLQGFTKYFRFSLNSSNYLCDQNPYILAITLGFRCASSTGQLSWHARLEQSTQTAAGQETWYRAVGVPLGAWSAWTHGNSIAGTYNLGENGVLFGGTLIPWEYEQNPQFAFDIFDFDVEVFVKAACNPLP